MISITPDVSVAYVVRPEDLEAILLQNYRLRPRRPFRPLLVGFALVLGMLTFLCIYAVGGRSSLTMAIFSSALVAGVMFAYSPTRVRELAVQRVGKRLGNPANAFLLGPRTLVLGAEGFAVVGEQSDLRYTWSALKRVIETRERLFLYFTDFTAHAPPLSGDNATRVLAAIRQYAPHAIAA
jgi:hypothetical protein